MPADIVLVKMRRLAGPSVRTAQPALTALAVVLLAAILVTLLVDHNSSKPAPGEGSGIAATQVREVSPFTGIDLAGANNVIVQVGARESVVVHADSNLLARVTTQVRSGKLVIGNTPGNLNAKAPMYVAVSVPSLDALALQGDGNITATGINSRSLTVIIPGSGDIHLTGATTRLSVTISGDGTALLGQLTARDASAVVSGDGTITLTATHSVSANVSGSGTISYGGNPSHVATSVTGSGTITPG